MNEQAERVQRTPATRRDGLGPELVIAHQHGAVNTPARSQSNALRARHANLLKTRIRFRQV